MELLDKFTYIDKVGLEIEGCWPKQRSDLIEDGSMRANEFANPYAIDTIGNKVALFGELLSSPLDTPQKVFQFLQNNWVSETGRRCGYHIHVSLKNPDAYCACMSKEFYDGFVSKITEWAYEHCDDHRLFWERLCNHNEYCCDVFIPDVQASIVKKTIVDRRRYCMFNYCWGMHKTIECRLFPTFLELNRAITATNVLMRHFEDYLREHFPKRKPLQLTDEFEDGENDSKNNSSFVLPNFNYYAMGKRGKVPLNIRNVIERSDRTKPWEMPRKPKPIPDIIVRNIERRDASDHAKRMNEITKFRTKEKPKDVRKGNTHTSTSMPMPDNSINNPAAEMGLPQFEEVLLVNPSQPNPSQPNPEPTPVTFAPTRFDSFYINSQNSITNDDIIRIFQQGQQDCVPNDFSSRKKEKDSVKDSIREKVANIISSDLPKIKSDQF